MIYLYSIEKHLTFYERQNNIYIYYNFNRRGKNRKCNKTHKNMFR